MQTNFSRRLVFLSAAALLALFLGLALGSVGFSLKELLAVLGNKVLRRPLPEAMEPIHVAILWNIRIPRVLMAFLVGGSLAASGAVMQSILRNPLASSYTVGVSSGASLMAALVILTGVRLPWLGGQTVTLAAFLGALGTALLAMAIALRLSHSLENQTIILVGMVLSLFVNALLTLLMALSRERLAQLIFWQMGSFSAQSWSNVGVMLLLMLGGLLVYLCFGAELDLMSFGQDQALSAGVDIRRVKLLLLCVSALLTGAAVSFVGVIGFIDLIAPHLVRRLFGARHVRLVPLSALLGGGFMALCDLVGRTALAPQEIPVGAVSALIGAPFFLHLYFQRGRA